MKRIERHTLVTALAEAGNRAAIATANGTAAEHHAANVELLRMRLKYFTGRDEGPYWGPELDELCSKLTASEVHIITDLCWASYQGGMEHMRETDG